MGYDDIDKFTDGDRYPAFSAPNVGRSAEDARAKLEEVLQ